MNHHKELVYRGSGSDLATDIRAMLPEDEMRRLCEGLNIPASPAEIDREKESQIRILGERAAWMNIFRGALLALDYKGTEVERAKWVLEREQAVQMLRQVCAEHGDNDWPNHMHLADVIEKHLWNHLEA